MTDGFSSGSSSELINRKAERQSPDRECGESRYRDVPQADNARAAGGPVANTPKQNATPSQGSVRDEGILTLTAAEREAVRFCTTAALPETQKLGGVAGELCRRHGDTLRSLLERLK